MDRYSTISFPAFGIEINPPRALDLGFTSVYLYGVIIAIGLMLAVIYAWKRCKEFGIREDHLTDGVIMIVPFAILCARAYYCIFKWKAEFADNPISALYIWNGGLAIYGGVIGALIGVAVYCKVRKIKLPALLDMVALGFLIGQSLGRWGNFFNREAFGSETESFLRMGLLNTISGKTTYHHPTFLYESLWNALGFVLLHNFSKRRKYDGQVALGYVVWYGLGRALIEGLRTDSLYLGPMRVSQLLAAVSCLAAAIALTLLSFREHSADKLLVNQVAAAAALEEEEEEEEEIEAEEAEEASEESAEASAEEPAEESTEEKEEPNA